MTEALGAHIRTMLSHPPSILDSIADEGWRNALEAELPAGYAERIALELAVRTRAGGRIAPALSIAFRALDLVAIDQMHVVIVGQDPYLTAGDAEGLAFSASGNGGLPSSLARIFAELRRGLGCAKPSNSDLTLWVQREVLLLNNALTTKEGTAWGLASIDWETFTRTVLRVNARRSRPSAIRLWGRKAQALAGEFTSTARLVITSDHPRGMRRRGDDRGIPFRGLQPFSRANAFLLTDGRAVDWSLRY